MDNDTREILLAMIKHMVDKWVETKDDRYLKAANQLIEVDQIFYKVDN